MQSEIIEEEHDRNDLKIRTLTPIWTGNIQGNSAYVKETGIIGSLRWWYEVLVRGLNGYACDITSNDPKKRCDYDRDKTKICAACKLFGCTGWKRRFRLEVKNGSPIYEGTLRIKLYQNQWHLDGGIYGSLGTRVINASEGSYQNMVLSLLRFVSNWGALGAKTQQGYGIFHLIPGKSIAIPKISDLMEFVRESKNEEIYQKQNYLPNIKDFFFCKIQLNYVDHDQIEKNCKYNGKLPYKVNNINELLNYLRKDYCFLPTAPIVRYHIRQLSTDNGSRLFNGNNLRHFIMGSFKPKRIGSKIFVSHLYQLNGKWEMRIWGWIPKEVMIISNRRRETNTFKEYLKIDRDYILNTLREKLKDELEKIFSSNSVSILEWREFNSGRDTKEKIYNMDRFMRSLGDSQ